MRDEMRRKDEAMRLNYRRDKIPYFAWLYGDRSRGIIRIGRWTEEWTEFDWEKRQDVRFKKNRNVTPKKMLRLMKTFGHLVWDVETHLFLMGLPEELVSEWRTAFPDAIIDEEVV